MTQYYIFSETIWPSIRPALEHVQKSRRSIAAPDIHAGMNFCIILGSACYLEGMLEAGLKALLWLRREVYNRTQSPNLEIRRSMNLWFTRMENDLESRICSAVGAAGYDEMLELLCGEPLKGLRKVAPLWEGITVLFQLRNVLGHGREVKAHQIVSVSPIEEVFRGGYRHAENYLRKRKLIARKFTEAHSDYLFLSDPVADHFFDLVTQVPSAISESLAGKEKQAFDKAILPGKAI